MAKSETSKSKMTSAGTKISFGTANYILFVLAVALIIIGFYLLGKNETTIGPLLLVIAYSFLIPASILVGLGKSREDDEERLIESGSKK